MVEMLGTIVVAVLMFVPVLNVFIGAAVFGVPGFLLGCILTVLMWVEN